MSIVINNYICDHCKKIIDKSNDEYIILQGQIHYKPKNDDPYISIVDNVFHLDCWNKIKRVIEE